MNEKLKMWLSALLTGMVEGLGLGAIWFALGWRNALAVTGFLLVQESLARRRGEP